MNTLHVVLTKEPTVQYAHDAHLALMEDGYALPIDTQGNATVLLFRNVEDHIDGNGMAVLWLLQGEGTFFHDGEALALKKGDVVVFDDNVEHGFETNYYCVAVNFDICLDCECTSKALNTLLDDFELLHENLDLCSHSSK